VHLQAGNLTDLSNQPLRVVDNFNLGQTLVRGFAPGGIGPRDITNTLGGTNQGNALGGTNYWALRSKRSSRSGAFLGHWPERRDLRRRRFAAWL